MTENTQEVNGFFLHLSQCRALFNLPPESAMAAIKMCHDYCIGEEPESSDPIAVCAFGLMRPALDKSLNRAVSGRKGGKANGKQNEANASKDEANGSKLKQTEANASKEKQTKANGKQNEAKEQIKKNKEQEINNNPPISPQGGKRERDERNIIPPPMELVEAYCLERGNGISAQEFCDHYEATGWMVGKNKMRDWQAAVRTWENKRTQTVVPEQKPFWDRPGHCL